MTRAPIKVADPGEALLRRLALWLAEVSAEAAALEPVDREPPAEPEDSVA